MAFLAKYMKSHVEMASGYVSQSLQSKAELEKQWEVLSKRLNTLGGPIKTTGKWKQAWRDMRNNEKKKAALKCTGSTGNETPSTIKIPKSRLSEADEDVSAIGPVTNDGMDDVATTEILTHAGPSQTYMDFPGKKSPLFMEPEPQSPSHSPPNPLNTNVKLPSSTEPVTVRPVVSRSALFRRCKRLVPKLEYLNLKLLAIEEKKLEIKKEKNAALNRIADALVEMTKVINKKVNG